MTLIDETSDFNPSVRDHTPAIPTLESVIRAALTGFAHDLRVAMPVKVVKVHGNYRVDLQPLFQARYFAAKAPTTLPILPNVPVSMPGGVNWQVKYPIDEGDVGTCLYADRSLDSFLAGKGDPADPVDSRTHDLTDAIYIPGLTYDSLAAEREDTTNDLVLRNGSAEVRLERNGTFRIYSGKTNDLEFVDLVGQLAAHCETVVGILQSAMVSTMLGPQPFLASDQVKLAQAYATVDLLNTKLGKLKGA